MQKKDKLQLLVGKVWMYRANLHRVYQVRVNQMANEGVGSFDVVTDREFLSFPLSDFDAVVKEFLPVEQDKVVDTGNGASLPSTNKNALIPVDSLVATMMDSIERIKKDKNYIPQATAINSTIQTAVNMAKVIVDSERLKGVR